MSILKFSIIFIVLSLSLPYFCPIIYSSSNITKRRSSRRQRRPIPQTPQDYETVQKREHARICKILSFAVNIFRHFIQLIKAPNDRSNVGNQVGNMAQDIFHLVAEATKRKSMYKSINKNIEDNDLLVYLNSQAFIKDLTSLILEQLENLPS